MYVDSDTGLESMSSAEAGANTRGEPMPPPRADAEQLRVEVCKLKNDKLDLLKQNIVSMRCDVYILFSLLRCIQRQRTCLTLLIRLVESTNVARKLN